MKGAAIPAGGRLITGTGSDAILALEDGTRERTSTIRLGESSDAVLTGGLFCSDLRPKVDEGRWEARKAGLELSAGSAVVVIAKGVSHSYDFEIGTPNTTARMVRGTQDEMRMEARVSGVGDRPMVPVMEHRLVRNHIAGTLMGRSVNDLPAREREAIMMQAAIAAFGMGLADMEDGVLDSPQLKATAEMMTRGRPLSELDENERASVIQALTAMAMQQGLINPEELLVPAEPDVLTTIAVHAGGRMRVYNSERGYVRDEAVEVRPGMLAEVKGYDVPAVRESGR